MRNMSFALTTLPVLTQTKDVTRRMGWLKLRPGEIFQPVRKCMGLKPGEKVEKLGGPVRTMILTREVLADGLQDDAHGWMETHREGFPGMSPARFIEMFCATHKGCTPASEVTRIEFSYDHLDGWMTMSTAPLDTEVTLLMRHFNWHYASPVDRGIWQEEVRGRWIDFNGGGWTWGGMVGTPIAWKP